MAVSVIMNKEIFTCRQCRVACMCLFFYLNASIMAKAKRAKIREVRLLHDTVPDVKKKKKVFSEN